MPPVPVPSDIVDALAHVRDRLGPFAREIFWYPDVSSTNDVAAALAERGVPEGCVVGADSQSAGRGRHGRSWASPAGAGLYISAVLRPDLAAIPLLSIGAGVAVAEGIERSTGLRVDLKWPNDVYVGERKLAGVLAEASTNAAGTLQHVILGIGINLIPAAYPADVAARATSLEDELSRSVDRGLLCVECLCALAGRYRDLQQGHAGPVVDAWRVRAASMLGRRVRWDGSGTPIEGVAENVDAAGALLVRANAGIVRVTSGIVMWL